MGQAEACPPVDPHKAHGLDRVNAGIGDDEEGFVAQPQTFDAYSVYNAVPGQVAAHIACTAEEAPPEAAAFPTLAALSDTQLFAILAAQTVGA